MTGHKDNRGYGRSFQQIKGGKRTKRQPSLRGVPSLIVLAALLICGSVRADWRTDNYTDTVITSLPATLSTNNRDYIISSNLSSNGDGLTVTCTYCKVIDSTEQYVLTYDADAGGNDNGLIVTGGAAYVVFQNVTFTQFQTASPVEYGSYGGSNSDAIFLGNCTWLYFENCNAHCTGHSSKVIEAGLDADVKYGIEIKGGNYTSYTNSFDSRHNNDAAVMSLADVAPSIPDSTYHYYVHGITVDSACHAGLLVAGRSWVDSNNVTIDTHNEKPGTSWANAHAIADNGMCWAGSRFNYNVITTDSNHSGGRGMYFNCRDTLHGGVFEVAYNTITVSQGNSTEDQTGRGIRLRWGLSNVRCHHNVINVTADDDPGTLYRGNSMHGIWLSGDMPGAVGCPMGSDTGTNNWVYNNEVHATWLGTGTAGTQAAAICLDIVADPNEFGAGNICKYNDLYSNVQVFQMGNNYAPCNQVLSYRDTITWESPHFWSSYAYGWYAIGSGDAICTSSVILDPILINCTVHDSIRSSGGTGELPEVYISRTVAVHVVDSFLQPVSGATVRVKDISGNLRMDKTTDVNGNAVDTIPFFYRQWNYQTLIVDSLMTPDTVLAFLALDSADTIITLNATQNAGSDFAVTLELPIGEGETPVAVKLGAVYPKGVRIR